MFKFSKLTKEKVLFPLIEELIHKKGKKTQIIGFQAGQGLGKTTVVNFVKKELKKRGYKVEGFSIDDFYLSNTERKKLAKKNLGNKFYQISRGMPGTHRYKLLMDTLKKIRKGENFSIPQFDKSKHKGEGDVLKKVIRVKGKQDFVLFDGWCVGVPLVSEKEFVKISKKYKIDLGFLDPTGGSKKVLLNYVKKYQQLWKYLDYMVVLKPENYEWITKWRNDQEVELIEEKGEGMSYKQVKEFVSVYLPLTFICYDKIKADFVMTSSKKHEFYKIWFLRN